MVHARWSFSTFQPHFRVFLNNNYTNRWIGRRGPTAWPARYSDLNPLDFYLWGHLKAIVYDTPVATVEALRNRIIVAREKHTKYSGTFWTSSTIYVSSVRSLHWCGRKSFPAIFVKSIKNVYNLHVKEACPDPRFFFSFSFCHPYIK